MAEAKEKTVSKKKVTKKEIQAWLTSVEQNIADNTGADIHSFVSLNTIMNQPNSESLLTGALKNQVKDIFTKLQASGLDVQAPPGIFGLPENFADHQNQEEESERVKEYEEFSD